jgi:hypothetical protein
MDITIVTDKTIHILIPTTFERRQRLSHCIDSIHRNAGYPHIISTYENYREGFVKPCHRLLRDLKPETMVWCIGDDTILSQPDTLRRLMGVFEECPSDIVLQPDDGIHHGRIITMPFCAAGTMLENGIHLEFFLNFCDNVFTEIMVKKRKYVYCPEIRVEHQHWINRKAPPDDTYAYAASKFDEDRAAYYRVRAKLGLM